MEKNINKQWLITILLAFFVGNFGIHRFYHKKIWTGVLQLITLGCFGVWTIIDIIFIALEEFTDSNGNKIKIFE